MYIKKIISFSILGIVKFIDKKVLFVLKNDHNKATDNKDKKKFNTYAKLSNPRVERLFKSFS
tara:strand:+ start:378 stop:563 length:186 start_codon:yes stop_codon:yes gene_type:complete